MPNSILPRIAQHDFSDRPFISAILPDRNAYLRGASHAHPPFNLDSRGFPATLTHFPNAIGGPTRGDGQVTAGDSIGRLAADRQQERTDFGGRIDLLAIAPDASLVLIELKRDRTPREVVAQALDYAAWVA